MMRKPIFAANWKMQKTIGDATAFAQELLKALRPWPEADLVLCAPFTMLAALSQAVDGASVAVGGQDLFWEPEGPYTGEISAKMLVDVGCRYVMIGHSERRSHFGETDEAIHRKVKAALGQGLIPIVCVGERLAEREANRTLTIVESQLSGDVGDLTRDQVRQCIIAYEPVWAIGTGKNATPDQAQEVHRMIRAWMEGRFGPAIGHDVRIQYGGSVQPANIASLMAQPDVDGALVGGASLTVESFVGVVRNGVGAGVRAAARGHDV